MASVAEHENQAAYARAGAVSAVASVAIYGSLAEAEAIWRGMETPDYLHTSFQRFDFLNAWQGHAGVHLNTKPLIVVASDREGRPLMLLPLGTVRENGVNVARFLGGKHPTFNMGLWRRDFAASICKADIDTILAAIAAHRDGIDLLALAQQPERWDGILNPLARLAHQPSANACPLLRMPPGAQPEDIISSGFRRRIRTKEKKLKALPGYRFFLARTDEDITRVLDAFFAIKPLRMAAQNLPNVFADAGIETFVRTACLSKAPNDGRAIVIHALECDDEVLAMFAGVADGHRISMMFNTYTMSESAKYSPGLILLRNIIDRYAGLGYRAFDLGIGSDDYKRWFCKDDEPIFDNFIPLSAYGRLAALGMSSLNHAKRMVKQNPALVAMAHRLRAALHR
jgi:CelD/BcsL family acetyltransferase involved in cellulose biosynthesis